MNRALHAEWTKLRTVWGPVWLLFATIALTAAVGTMAVAAVTYNLGSDADPVKLSLTGIDLGQAVIAILAVTVVSGEYGTGMIRVSFSAMPRRSRVLAAKAIVLTAAVAVTGTLAVLGSLLAGRVILPGNGFTAAHGFSLLSLADGPTLRAAAGSVLYLVLIALFSLGIAAAVRDSVTSTGIILALLYLFPILASTVNPHWQRRLDEIAPMTAGLYIQATRNVHHLPLTPWQGLGVLAAWATAALGVGGLLLHLRDA